MSLQLLKDIVHDKAYAEITWPDVTIVQDHDDEKEVNGGIIVDMQTANMLITVYNALETDANKQKFEQMLSTYTNFSKLVDFGWKQVH